jgi:N-acetylmuramoyl-L-alanine amidase
MNGLDALLAIGAGFLAAATPVGDNTLINRSNECLAMNMYHEARNQGTAGVLAVTAVVLNRVHDDRFPDTICEVVEQGPTRSSWKDPTIRYPIKNRCQFSWYCDGISDTPHTKEEYQYFLRLSTGILSKKISFIDITDGATFYHADYVSPAWAKTKTKTIEIQDHIFYKWKRK